MLDIVLFALASILLVLFFLAMLLAEFSGYTLAAWLGRWIIRIVSFNRIRMESDGDTSADMVVGALTVIGLFIVVLIAFP